MDRRSPVGNRRAGHCVIALVSARQPSSLRDAVSLAIRLPMGRQEIVLFSPYPLAMRSLAQGTARIVTSIRASQEVGVATC
jgi:hypothetical protein